MSNPRVRDFAPVGNPNAGRHKVAAAIHKLQAAVKTKYSVDIGYDTRARRWEAWLTRSETYLAVSMYGTSPMQAAERLIENFPEFFNSQQ